LANGFACFEDNDMKNVTIKGPVMTGLTLISVAIFAAMPTDAYGHTLVFDTSQYDTKQFDLDQQSCTALLDNVGQHEGAGAAEQGVKRGLRGATAGALAGGISGNSASDAARTGAAIGTTVGVLSGRGSKQAAASANQKERNDLMRSCMHGRGYQALN
jgi:hypothetical protein